MFSYIKYGAGIPLKYMGPIISEKGLSPDRSKIEAIVNIKTPSDVKHLQSFLGVVTYVGKFVKNLSELTAPLRNLLKNKNNFN